MLMYLVIFMMGITVGAGLLTLGYFLGKSTSDRTKIEDILDMIEDK